MTETLKSRLARVRARIAAVVSDHVSVTLIGVSKRQPVAALHEAADAGLFEYGENYAQELRDKRREITDPRAKWHFIGPVQTNKVKYVIGTACIHTVDRDTLLAEINRRAARQDLIQTVLIQVNIAAEPQKHGAPPADVPALLDRCAGLSHVRCHGLMLIPPAGTPEQTRSHFRALRQFRDDLARTTRPHVELGELSMGMSADFEVAIAEGATMVRVGTAIFGPRPPR